MSFGDELFLSIDYIGNDNQSQPIQNNNKCVSKMHIDKCGEGGSVKTMCNALAPFQGIISVADCMPLSSLLQSSSIDY